MKDKVPDYSGILIKKLPPGTALGADDLTRWAHRRAVGSTGTGTQQTRALKLICKSCGEPSEILNVERGPKKNSRGIFDCRHCGAHAARVQSSKRLTLKGETRR